jgi:S1-C subfamily serine protease
MRYIITAIALAAIGFTACAVVRHDVRAEVMREVSGGAVTVYTSDGSGSGTVIARDGDWFLTLTCQHVTGEEVDVYVENIHGRFPATVLKADERKDLALLVTNGKLGASVVRVALEEPHLYDRLYAVTSPLGIPNTGSEGILYDKNTSFGPAENGRWAFTGFILPGSSGGTITNAEGELVCVAEAIRRGPPPFLSLVPELAFCVGLKDIKDFTREYRLGN